MERIEVNLETGERTVIPLTDVEIAAAQAAAAALPPPPVPSITKAQALLWLYPRGKREADVLAVINSLPTQEQIDMAMIEWNYRRDWEVTNPLLQALWPALGIEAPLADAMREAALL